MDLRLELWCCQSLTSTAPRHFESVGFRLDADVPGDDGFRVVQLTPPGSPASIIFGNGVTASTPGFTQGIYLVVDDIGPRKPRGSRLGRHIGSLDRIGTGQATRRLRPSATPTATAGCCKKSPSACLAASGQTRPATEAAQEPGRRRTARAPRGEAPRQAAAQRRRSPERPQAGRAAVRRREPDMREQAAESSIAGTDHSCRRPGHWPPYPTHTRPGLHRQKRLRRTSTLSRSFLQGRLRCSRR